MALRHAEDAVASQSFVDFGVTRHFHLVFSVRPDVMAATVPEQDPPEAFELSLEFAALHDQKLRLQVRGLGESAVKLTCYGDWIELWGSLSDCGDRNSDSSATRTVSAAFHPQEAFESRL